MTPRWPSRPLSMSVTVFPADTTAAVSIESAANTYAPCDIAVLCRAALSRYPSKEEHLMNQRNRIGIVAGLAMVIAGGIGTAQADEPTGQELFKFHGCVNCHGAQGKAPISKLVPKLGGKPAGDLYEKATKILSGEGGTEESKLMHAAFYSPSNCDSPPTDAQVKEITAWLAEQ